jgi:predicted neuraminidase
MRTTFLSLAICFLLCASVALAADKPFHEAELIFPMETFHNHASSIVELPNQDLFVCWYHGSGEKGADDVRIEAARLPKGSKTWSQKFTLADTPNFPDTNPTLFLDRDKRLWLIWQVILANEWHTALTKYKIATDYLHAGPPKWSITDDMLFIPRNFGPTVKREIAELAKASDQQTDRSKAWMKSVTEKADDKYFSRMGWMTRVHPIQLPSGRILVGLYSDGYSFSLVAISDDNGASWTTSEPLVGGGNVQPSLVRKKDGTIVTYMRDNGPAPKRIPTSFSKDEGITWSPVVDTDIPNPGTSVEVVGLRDGTWLLIYNDLERGRNSLAVSVSDDEGATWKWTRHLDRDMRTEGAGQFHYPSIIQAQDGSIHATYSYYRNDLPKGSPSQTIKHAHFNVEWLKQGDPK